ncbi:MAG TPA: hypothetical protein VGR35_13335 [Tepidisphaeraceae bacterium]|nr:hypothetical protein [Tepidisphaeraceae bacterium]
MDRKAILTVVVLAVVQEGLVAQPTTSTRPASQPTARDAVAEVLREMDVVIDEILPDGRFPSQSPSTRPAVPKESDHDRLRREAMEVLTLAEKPPDPQERVPFDDVSNRRFVKQANGVFRDFKMRLSDVTLYLLCQHQAQELSGIRLELLARLSQGHLEQLKKAIGAPPS